MLELVNKLMEWFVIVTDNYEITVYQQYTDAGI